jgi:hypothetical protein
LKLGIQYVVVASLLVGIITGLFINSFVETPLNPTKVVTTRVTAITTVTTIPLVNEKVTCLGMPSLTWEMHEGLVSYQEILKINPDGSGSFYSRSRQSRPDINVSLTFSRPEFSELCSIVTRINFSTLKAPYVNSSGFILDSTGYSLTVDSLNENGLYRIFDWDANYYVPNELLDFKDRFMRIDDRIFAELGVTRY